MTIYDLVRAPEVAAYWEGLSEGQAPLLGETLFPNQKKLGMTLSWIKGKSGLPVSLKLSAFDVQAVPRQRIGFNKVEAEMPFFKESMYVDETLRQELNKVMETGNTAYIEAVMNRVFDDQAILLDAARVARERMRMQLITTGVISMKSNGQEYEYNYGIDESQKIDATTSWSDPSADIIGDIQAAQDAIEDATGVRPVKAVMNRKTWGYILKNTAIIKSIYALSDGNQYVSDATLKNFLVDQLGLSVTVYSKKFMGDNGVAESYVPDDTVSLIPDGDLGNTWFGTTPEESDLMASSAVDNVAIVDTGVAVTTMRKADPVNVETKVTQICLPSFSAADQIAIIDVA